MKKAILFLFFLVILSSFVYADLNMGLNNAYALNESSGNAIDYVNAKNSNAPDVTYQANGINGYGYLFVDGSQDDVQWTDATGLPVGNQDRSTALWFNATNQDSYTRLWIWGDESTNEYWGMAYDPGGDLRFIDYGDDTTFDVNTALNKWYFVVATYDSSTSNVTVYLNGTYIGYKKAGPLATGTDRYKLGISESGIGGWFSGILDEFYIWNRTLSSDEIAELYHNGAGYFYPFVAPDTTPPTFSNQVKNDTTIYVNEDVIFNITIIDDNADSYKFFWNASGSFSNDTSSTYTSGIAVSTTKTINSTLAHKNICWGYWANDTAGHSNSSLLDCFTVANTAPPNVTTWTFPSTDPDHDNHNITFNWSAVTDVDEDAPVYYAFYLNDILKQNTTDTTWTAGFEADGDYEYYIVTNDGFENGIPSATRIFTLDTTLPAITWHYPSPLNTTISNKDLTLDISCSDINLYQLLVNVTNSSGNEIYSNNYSTTTETTLTANDIVNFTYEDIYVVKITCSDQHTAKIIPDYGIEKDVSKKKLTYNTGDNTISISLKDSVLDIDGFNTEKLKDRYTFSYDFSSLPEDDTVRTFVFVLEAQYPLIYLKDSKYKAHFISNKNWIDFNLDDEKVKYDVKKISDYKYEISISTTKKLLDFNSIGGLNIVEEHVRYTYEITAPYYINNATNGSVLTKTGETVHFNITWFDQHPSHYVFCLGDGSATCTNQTPHQYTSGQHIMINETIDAVHNQQVSWQFYANDTAGNWNNTLLASFTVANTAPNITAPSINNSAPYTNDVLKCNNGSFIDADKENATWYYRWFDNDVLISGQTSSTLDLGLDGLDKNDIIKCEIRGSDGTDNSTSLNSSSVTIQNFIPTHSTPLLTSSLGTNYTNENLTCYNQSTYDGDEEEVTNIYNWYKDNEPINDLYLPSEINTNDYSGNGNDGTTYGGNFVNGKVGNGLSFNGSEYASIPDSSSLDFTNKKTWEIWFKRASTGIETIFDKTNTNNNLTNYKLYFDSSNHLVFTYSIPGVVTGDFTWVTATKEEFEEGSYGATYYNTTNNAVQLNISQGFTSGNYTSKVYPAGALSSWNNISWTEEVPYGEELPNNKGSDKGADMTGNVLLMHMNEASGTIIDYSGEGNNGTQNGGVTYSVAGKFNTALSFDGVNDYVNLGDNYNFERIIPFSLELWFKSTATGTRTFVSRRDRSLGAAAPGWALLFADGGIKFQMYNTAGNFFYAQSDATFNNGLWNHIVMDYDGSSSYTGVKIYVNGAVASLTGSGSITGTILNSANCNIGAMDNGYFFYSDLIDEVAIYNRSLTADEILNSYKRGVLRLNLTVTSCENSSCSQVLGNVNCTDADYCDISSLSDSQYLQYKALFETDNANYTPKLYNVTVGYTKYGVGVDETTLTSTTQIIDTNWHYAAVTFDNDTLTYNFKLYLDGSLNNSKTEHNTSQYTVNDLYIGRNYQGTNYFNGTLDEFRIYDYALTPEQINNNFNLNYNKIISTETTRGDSYICSITPNDAENDGITKNSTTLIIRNYIPSPAPSLISPEEGYTSGILPEFNWTESYDTIDNDFVYYIIQIDNNSDFSSLDYTNKLSTNKDTSVTLDSTKIDTYWWRVLATDNIGNSSWSSPIRQFTYASWNITFNVTSGELTHDELNYANISYCNYTGFNQAGDTTNVYGPYTFLPGDWECTFRVENYYDQIQTFTADSDKMINIIMQKIGQLTDQEHTWLEALYNCIILGDCELWNLLRTINQTTQNIWSEFKRRDESVVAFRNQTGFIVNETSNITIDYRINIPIKTGYPLGTFLPIRIGYWFLNASNESCYDQGDKPTGVVGPYCQPLMTQTMGPMGGSVSFTVTLQPELPTGNYTIVEDIEIDPNERWMKYSQEIVGGIEVTEESTSYGVKVERTDMTYPQIPQQQQQSSGGGGGGGRSSPTIYSPTIYGPTYINNTYITIEPSDKSEEDEERSQEGEIEQPKESGIKGITGAVIASLPKASPVVGSMIIIVIVVGGLSCYLYIFSKPKKKLKN